MNKQKILIVDDRPENLLVLESILETLDIEIITSMSGEETLQKVMDDDFTIIILDVQMPGMNGFEIAKYLRGVEKTKYIPIIFVTAISKDEEYIFQGYEVGAVDYLFKPVEPHILKSKVAVFLQLQQQKNIIKKQAEELQQKINEVKVLRGILPICSHCKKIRNDKGFWQQVDAYLQEHTEAELSHGICTDCAKKHYPQFYEKFKDRLNSEKKS